MQTETTGFAQARTSRHGLSPKVRATIFFGTDYEYQTDKVSGLGEIELSKSFDRGKFSPGSITLTIDNSDLKLSDNRWPTRVPSKLKDVDAVQDFDSHVWYKRYFYDLIKIEYGLLHEGTYRWLLQGIYYIEEKKENYNNMTVTFVCGDIMKIVLDTPISILKNGYDIFSEQKVGEAWGENDDRRLQLFVKYGKFRQDRSGEARPIIPCVPNREPQYVNELDETVPAGQLFKPLLANGILSVESLNARPPTSDLPGSGVWNNVETLYTTTIQVIYDQDNPHLVKWIKTGIPLPNLDPMHLIDFPWLFPPRDAIEFVKSKIIDWFWNSSFSVSATTVQEPIRVLYDFLVNVCDIDSSLIDASADLSNPANAYDYDKANAESFDRTGQIIKSWKVEAEINEEISALEFINEINELMNATIFSSLDYKLKCVLDGNPLIFTSEKEGVPIKKDYKKSNLEFTRKLNQVRNWIEVRYYYANREIARVETDATSVAAYGLRAYIIPGGSSKNVRLINKEAAQNLAQRKLSQSKEPELLSHFNLDAEDIIREINDPIKFEDDISGMNAHLELFSVRKNLINGSIDCDAKESRIMFPQEDEDAVYFAFDNPDIGFDDDSVALW